MMTEEKEDTPWMATNAGGRTPWHIKTEWKDDEGRRCTGFITSEVNGRTPEEAKANALVIASSKDLASMVVELADDLEAELNDRYPTSTREHPAMKHRYDRDMDPVRRARVLLAQLNADESMKP